MNSGELSSQRNEEPCPPTLPLNLVPGLFFPSLLILAVKGVILIGDPEHKPGLACNVDAQGGSSTKNAIGVESFRGGIPEAWIPKTLDICALVSDPNSFFFFLVV